MSRTPGWPSRNRANAGGASVTSAVGKLPKRNRPRRRPAISASSCSAPSSRAKIPVAWRTRAWPASVSSSGRVPRSITVAPTSRSSAAMCWLTADWVSVSARAASENDRRSATSERTRRRRTSSISATYRAAVIAIATDGPRCDARPMAIIDSTPIDPDKLESFVFRAVDEVGATLNAALVVMGDRLGLYRALAGAGPLTAGELAERAGVAERYTREWLNAQAAGGYVSYEPDEDCYRLPAEQAVALTDTESAAYLPGLFELALGSVIDSPRITEAARTGAGVGWHDHGPHVHDGCERFFRPGYNAQLVASWLPALDGVVERLERGARVADVGCGHGASTILMAQAFPRSAFAGSDYHEGSIATARRRAEEAGVAERVRFETAPAAGYPGRGYDLVTMFDCLHDMGDPVGAARHVLHTLAPDGTWMIVEPAAGDRIEDNLDPVGRAYYGFSTLLCTPASLSQDVGLALGAQAGPARIAEVVTAAGFTRFRQVAGTPFNLVFEARP